MAEMVSPKTYQAHCSQLEQQLQVERQEAIRKFRNAEQALLLIAEIDDDQEEGREGEREKEGGKEREDKENERNNPQVDHLNESRQSPQKKTLNLYINVDEIDS